MSRKLITVAALAAVALSSAGTASAAVKAPAKAGATKLQGKGSARRAVANRPGVGVWGRGSRVVFVKGSSTGSGPATNAECQNTAADIDTALEAAADYLIEDQTDQAEGMLAAIDEITANAVKRGCVFKY